MSNTDEKAQISSGILEVLAKESKSLTIQKEGISLEFSPQSLINQEIKDELKENIVGIEIGIKEIPAEERAKILAQAEIGQGNNFFDVGGRIFELSMEVVLNNSQASTGEISNQFGDPVAVTIDLSDAKIAEEDISKLTGIRYEKNENDLIVAIKLGGVYNPDTKKFTFYTDKFSMYGVLKSQELKQVNLKIGEKIIKVNEVVKHIDVAPAIINNRTMVPLRVVAEGLGTEVEWISSNKTVNIKIKDQSLNMVIGKTIPGIDSPPVLTNNRVLVPIRYISESLGAHVMWFSSTQSVHIVL
ncbi:copper amine oxidase N-terminal domain-containing protein [Desulfallas thermosapovorans]|uniref:copper amine oxidase N-terminal domain-containing protein n=1 Tax=Desulfallas thermosapovorans TaxID=58137 RepID=UPI001412197D|nr:copper amine oxidase N-terminal domain-containing protein [Desulfallas thermosapovorans]